MSLPIILASSSPYRRELLAKLGLRFTTQSPDIDESPHPGESPEALVARLAQEKAQAIAHVHGNALIIASDQIAVLNDKILGKPSDHANAVKQLNTASGQSVRFLTSLALLNSSNNRIQLEVVPFTVHFRTLSTSEIENYLQKEQPYNCTGSFKSETLGITLFERLEGDDPHTLIGLPLIRLVRMLKNEAVNII